MDSIHWIRLAIDFFVLSLLVAVFTILKYAITPFYSGFYCDDYSVNMPYKASTINNKLLIVLSTVMPFLVMILTELARTFYMMRKRTPLSMHNRYKIIHYTGRLIEWPEQFGNMVINYGTYSFGLLCNLIITLIGKQTIGRLRPNFLDICKPDIDVYEQLCKGKKYLRPLEDFKCLNPNSKEIDESRKSFPSGHSSTMFYTCLFLVFYINKTWNKRNLGLLPQFVQFAFLCLAFFTGLSRVIDNKHHPTDVMAGSLIGIFNAVFTFYYLHLFFKRYNFKNKYDPVATTSNEVNMRDESSSGTETHLKKSKNTYCTKVV